MVFPPIRKQLRFSKGDTLVILSKMSPDWFKARDAQGETGLIPVKFVRVIGETPPTSPRSVGCFVRLIRGYEKKAGAFLKIKKICSEGHCYLSR
jgi:hypothetical protein